MVIDRAQLDTIVEHALRDAPDECCGLIAIKDGVAQGVFPLENTAHSPFRFEMGGPDYLKAYLEIDDAGHELAVYHSHTRSDPYPSQTDVTFAAKTPGSEWLIVGTKSPEPVVRSYLIDGGTITEVEVTVDDR